MPSDSMNRLRRLAIDRLESLERAGVAQLPRANRIEIAAAPTETAEPTVLAQADDDDEDDSDHDESLLGEASADVRSAPAPAPRKPSRLESSALFDAKEPDPALNLLAPTLEALQQQVAACTRCAELAATRTQTVFGVGNPQARLCFLGEAPGADEDRLGEPFVGRGGQLLDKIIEACKLRREDVYILNMIKCRPPGNRNPLPSELSNCRGYLDTQLALIQPEFICCLGAVASHNLLGTTTAIGKLRGKIHSYRDAKVVCTYHPAFLLRSPSYKKEAWDDMKLLMRQMGVEL